MAGKRIAVFECSRPAECKFRWKHYNFTFCSKLANGNYYYNCKDPEQFPQECPLMEVEE